MLEAVSCSHQGCLTDQMCWAIEFGAEAVTAYLEEATCILNLPGILMV